MKRLRLAPANNKEPRLSGSVSVEKILAMVNAYMEKNGYAPYTIFVTVKDLKYLIKRYHANYPSNDLAERIVADNKARGLSTYTTRRQLHELRYWSHAIGVKFTYDIYGKSPLIQRKARYLSDEDREKLIKAADNSRDLAIILVLLHCGLRNKEIRWLYLEDVDLDNRLIHVRDHGQGVKNKREYPVVMSHRCASAVDRWLKDRPLLATPHLFVTVDGRMFSQRGLEEVVYRLKRNAKVEGRVYPHLCRHDCFTRMAMAGVSESLIQLQSGHRDRRSLQVYINPDINSLRMAVDKTMR